MTKPNDLIMDAAVQRDASILDMVQTALKHKMVFLMYQPVVLAADPAHVAYYEAFLRIEDPTGRVIPARDFISAIEISETGRILDCLSLERGLSVLQKRPDVRIAVNMSARSVGYSRWIKTLDQAISQNPLLAERLILEINEDSAMHMPDLLSSFVETYQHRGVSFALDDFGAGMTAFRTLHDFMFDMIKIDGHFSHQISDSPDNQMMVRAIMAMAREMGMFTVAEKVERQQDAKWLCSQGLDCLQGYYFGAPTKRPNWLMGEQRQSA